MHIEFFVEEESAEAFLQGLVPKVISEGNSFFVHVFQGKRDLLGHLPARLKGYRNWLPVDWRIAVLVDEDRQDCKRLKAELEAAARGAGFATKTSLDQRGQFVVLNRVAIEELEAWYFGDVEALVKAYPGVPPTLDRKEKYREPDAIPGGTWETLERVLQRAGYFPAGLPKMEVARKMAPLMDPQRNRSKSFQHFVAGLRAFLEPSEPTPVKPF
ncbi:MAG: DUF4276 family protein [Verrucomicrobia bacterium]|nr:DUF4276 family protein [Verrucomicrobiota bacterium]